MWRWLLNHVWEQGILYVKVLLGCSSFGLSVSRYLSQVAASCEKRQFTIITVKDMALKIYVFFLFLDFLTLSMCRKSIEYVVVWQLC